MICKSPICMLAQSKAQIGSKIVGRMTAYLQMPRFRSEFLSYKTWREFRRFLENKGEATPRFFESPANSRQLMERSLRKLKDPELEKAWKRIKKNFEERYAKRFKDKVRDPWRPKPPFRCNKW